WNLQGKELHSLAGHQDWVMSVTFSPDGETLASASADKTVKLWNLQGEELHSLAGHQDWVIGVAFSPDGKTLASASGDKTVKLWRNLNDLTVDALMQEACTWVGDYLKYNAPQSDRYLCDNVGR
ncbi:MAG: stage II sporulation protein E, partial [Jaaginema sp. PMC 1080.18]|nr:stage II sporulation protein E [Jaaginema sp. PMC 1080.18]